MLHKSCTKCLLNLPLTDEFFQKRTDRDGFRSICKICTSQRLIDWKNRTNYVCHSNYDDRKKEYMREYVQRSDVKIKIAKRRENNRKKNNELSKRYYEQNRDAINQKRSEVSARFKKAQEIASRRHLNWSLSFDDYQKIIMDSCYYCDYKLGSPVKMSTGLDRLDNLKGYEIGNVVSCCLICNRIRGNVLSPEEAKLAIQTVLDLRSKV